MEKYRELKHLGAGGMGTVILIERREDQQKFAAKKQQSFNDKAYDRAKAELKVVQKLNHENIVKFEESFSSDSEKALIIIIEYCPCKFNFFSSNVCS